jgi:TolA-binding protein
MSSNIIYHKHHIIPKHAGGSNDPSNLAILTIEEHSEAHRILYEKYGLWQDKCAWLALSKQITNADATKYAQRMGRLNKPMSEETKEKIRLVHLGKSESQESIEKRRQSNTGKKRAIRSEEWCNNISKGKKGKSIKGTSHTNETKEKISMAKKGQSYNKGRVFSKICCPLCQKEVSFNRLSVHQQSKTCSKVHNFGI